jgi:hypothetical protein
MPLAPAPAAAVKEVPFTTEFRLEECAFSDRGGNPYFSLQPGRRLVLEGAEDGDAERVEISVLNQTRLVVFRAPSGKVLQVRTRIVQETEWVNGELVEVSRNFFARCQQTGDIFYFGEEVDDYEGGVIVGHEGSWLAGAAGALPGLVMPGRFLLGSRYFQEQAPGVALDRAEHVAMGLTVEVPAGRFQGCVEVLDTNALEPREPGDVKIYCPGVGLVVDEEAELVEFEAGTR